MNKEQIDKNTNPSIRQDTILNISNPVPILQQPPSNMTTNIFIPKNDQDIVTVERENADDLSMNEQISNSFIGFLNDLYNKPEDINWSTYLIQILKKNNRYTYFGILLIIIAILYQITITIITI
jgi:hypothetical protein